MRAELLKYSKEFKKIQTDVVYAEKVKMPSGAYFLEDGSILALPREDGDSRYPYGKDGFNFWTYASGYMHSNMGLFSTFLRASEGAEPKIAFFAGIEGQKKEQYEVISLLSVPVLMETKKDVMRYTIFTTAATYFFTEVEGLLFAIRTVVDGKNNIYFSLFVECGNTEGKNLWVSTYFNPLIKNSMFENSTDRWFRKAEFLENGNLGDFVFEAYEEKDRSSMTTNYGIIKKQLTLGQKDSLKGVEITTSRSLYVGGSRSSLHTPKALLEGTFGRRQTICSFTETAIAGDIIKLNISDGIRIDMKFAYCFTEDEKNSILTENITPLLVDQVLDKLYQSEKKKSHGLAMKFENEISQIRAEVVNPFIEHLKKQVEFCSVIKGYVQLSSFSLIGIRDVFQALEGLAYWQPQTVRNKMLEALNFISTEGRCPRQYSLPIKEGSSPAMDLRPFIDQGVWVISTVITYLRLTKDYDFLSETCGYYDFVDAKKHIATKSNLKSTVLQHMMDIMGYLLRNRDTKFTNCVCALYGDWNDALDGLGFTTEAGKEYGTGVSVMATLQVYQNLSEMIELLQLLDTEHSLVKTYIKAQIEIKEGLKAYAVVTKNQEQKILHGWGDKRSYLVGSYEDPDLVSREGITSNAFWVLSGLYDEDMGLKKAMLSAYDKLDSKYGFKTFEPPFEKNTYGVGRIPNLPAGTAENGAVYIHASLFAVMALFRMGESKKAWEQLTKLLPFTHEKISLSPYVIPNSYGYNETLTIDGESMGDWQTGSSNVLLKTLIRFVFGFEPHHKGVFIQPSKNQPFKQLELSLQYLGKELTIKYENKESGQRQFFINEVETLGQFDEVMQLDKLWLADTALLDQDYVIKVID